MLVRQGFGGTELFVKGGAADTQHAGRTGLVALRQTQGLVQVEGAGRSRRRIEGRALHSRWQPLSSKGCGQVGELNNV